MPDQFRQVNGPQGPINFPNSMDDTAVESAMRKLYPPKQAAPTPPTVQEKIGSYVPEAATSALAWGQRNLVDPIENFVAKAADAGGKAGKAAMAVTTHPVEAIKQFSFDRAINPGTTESPVLQQTAKEHPIATGVAEGVGKTVGGIAFDPRNWPLMGGEAARPILQTLMKRGFQAMMTKGTYDAAKDLHDNWDKMTPEERAARGTEAGISAAMTAGLFAQKGEPARKPGEVPIAATGKTGPEIKKETSSPSTGLTADEIRARIKVIEDKIAAEKKPAPVAAKPPEPPKVTTPVAPVETPKPKPEQGTYFGPQAARDLPGAEDLSKYPAQANKGVAVPGVVDAVKAAKQVAKPIEAIPESRQGPAVDRTPVEPPKPTPNIKSYSGYVIVDGVKEAKPTFQVPEKPANLFGEEGIEGYTARRNAWKAQYETPEPTKRSKVGGSPAPPEAANSQSQSVPSAQEATPSGEPVRSTSPGALKPELKLEQQAAPSLEPRIMRGDETGQRLGQRPPETKRSLNPVERLELTRTRAAELQKKYPNIAKTRIQEMASEQIKKEQGSFGGGGMGDPKERREEKVNEWIRQIGDPKTSPGALHDAYNMLKAYGLSPDDIIKRSAGGADFASHPDDPIGGLQNTRSLKQEIDSFQGDPKTKQRLHELLNNDKLARGYWDDTPEHLRQEFLDKYHVNQHRIYSQERMNDAFVAGETLPHKPMGFGDLVDSIKGHPDALPDKFKPSKNPPPTSTTEGAKFDTDTFNRVKQEHPDWTLSDQLKEAAKQAGAARESLEERIGDPKEFRQDSQADREAERVGSPSVAGVKDPGLQELERMHSLDDIRKDRQGERGSLSFRRIPDDERKSASPVDRLADALDRVADVIERPGRLAVRGLDAMTDEAKAQSQTAKNIIRVAGAKLDKTRIQIAALLEDAMKRHDSPINERQNFIDFMDAGEGKEGAKFLNPEDQAIAGELHRMFQERWDKVKEVKGLEGEGVENYLSHMWEKPNKAARVLTGLLTGKRPLEGSTKFLKNRFYQYASEGVANGLEPVSWNPIRLQLAALFNVDRFLKAHEIKDQYKDAGLVKWHKISDYKNVPTGWERLDDKIFQPKAVGDGALKEYGSYYAPPEVADIFNRHLSPGLRGVWAYDKIRSYANRLNMANLGLSGFHGLMVSLLSATSDVSLGLQQGLNYGELKQAASNITRGSVGSWILRSATQDFKLGRSIEHELIEPTGDTKLQKYVDLITQGGGRFKQDPFYTHGISERTGFANWLKLGAKGKFVEMATKGIQTASKPIMEWYVPRVKLGIAARMMEAKLDHLDKTGVTDTNTITTEMGKIWDSVDNRAGQMVYDNLFMNKVVKDLSFIAVRAVGWDLGSVREFGGAAAVDLPREAAKVLRGQRPELTHRLAFSIATPAVIGMFGAMVHYMMTGKAPQKTEDYFFPGPDGDKVSFPNYMTQMMELKRDPARTAVNKLNPIWGQMHDLYTNSDFYGTEIHHPGDPYLKQGLDVLKWYGKSYEPFGVVGMQKRMERGEPFYSAATGVAGFMPAPGWVSQTKAESLAVELSEREWKQGPRTTADYERYQLVQKFQQQVGKGQLDMKELTQAWKDKRIQDSDISRIYSNFQVPRLQREFKELPLPDALAVMREATPNERVQLKPLLLQKYGQLERYPLDTQQAYDRQIREYLK